MGAVQQVAYDALKIMQDNAAAAGRRPARLDVRPDHGVGGVVRRTSVTGLSSRGEALFRPLASANAAEAVLSAC